MKKIRTIDPGTPAECQVITTPEFETWCPDCGKGLEAKGDLTPMELRSLHFYECDDRDEEPTL